MNKRNFDESEDSTSTLPLATFRDADDGVVNGECHSLGLHGSYLGASFVVSANLTALPSNTSAYPIYKFHVLHVIKENASEPMQTTQWLTNRTIEVTPLGPSTPCTKTWHERQPYRELMAEYILFVRTPSGLPGDYAISTRDESGVFRSASGHMSPYWDQCRYEELLAGVFGMCGTCVDSTGVLIEEGTPLITDDGCLECDCVGRKISCRPRFCDLHTVAIVFVGVVVVALLVALVTFLYRRYRRRKLANALARRTVVAHRNTVTDDDPVVPLDDDNDAVALEEVPRQGLISRK